VVTGAEEAGVVGSGSGAAEVAGVVAAGVVGAAEVEANMTSREDTISTFVLPVLGDRISR
jgi:hypothetical protein